MSDFISGLLHFAESAPTSEIQQKRDALRIYIKRLEQSRSLPKSAQRALHDAKKGFQLLGEYLGKTAEI